MKRIITIASVASVCVITGLILLFVVRDHQSGVVTPPASAAEITAAKATVAVDTRPQTISGNPVGLAIPSLGIELPVTPGVYNDATKQWTLTSDKAQYAVATPPPNDATGNTFIYGHYRKGVFASLHTIGDNAEAIVTTDNGKSFIYKLSAVKTVTPEESTGIFDYQGPPIMTIQTCSGLFFQNRQLFTFTFEKVA